MQDKKKNYMYFEFKYMSIPESNLLHIQIQYVFSSLIIYFSLFYCLNQ